MIWLAIIIPVLFIIAALVFFRNKVAFWEPLIPIVLTLIVIAIFRYIGISSLTKDTEYWGNYATSVRWYQDWDEWITQTCTRSYPCGTDSKGQTTYCTETYDCSYRQYHPEYWVVVLNDKQEINIAKSYYDKLRSRFGAKDIFVDMGRHYYTDDGDMYQTNYPNTYQAFEYFATEHTYTNKVQASTSIFNFPKVTDKEKAKYKLYDYPKIENDNLPAILAPKDIKIYSDEQKRFAYINGMLGMSKKIRVWVCLFEYPTEEAALKQKAYWKGGNMNEFIICIGVDKNKNIQWANCFGWNESKTINIETRNYLIDQKKLDFVKFGDWLYKEVNDKWKFVSFDRFEYLSVQPPTWALITTFILSFVFTLGVFVWIVLNGFTSSDYNGDGYDEIDETKSFSINEGFIQKIKNLFAKNNINSF
jgi:hypothetical protein